MQHPYSQLFSFLCHYLESSRTGIISGANTVPHFATSGMFTPLSTGGIIVVQCLLTLLVVWVGMDTDPLWGQLGQPLPSQEHLPGTIQCQEHFKRNIKQESLHELTQSSLVWTLTLSEGSWARQASRPQARNLQVWLRNVLRSTYCLTVAESSIRDQAQSLQEGGGLNQRLILSAYPQGDIGWKL